jgi:hypothetical protein
MVAGGNADTADLHGHISVLGIREDSLFRNQETMMKVTPAMLSRIGSGTIPYKEPNVQNLDMFAFIDGLDREACKALMERGRARLSQLRINDPLVYGIQRIFRGDRRYHTHVQGRGHRQLLATDMGHGALWLTSSREWADHCKKCFEEDHPHPGEEWSVFEIPKTEAVKLPCYKGRYGENEEMTGVQP